MLLGDVHVGAHEDLVEHVLQQRAVGEALKLFAIARSGQSFLRTFITFLFAP